MLNRINDFFKILSLLVIAGLFNMLQAQTIQENSNLSFSSGDALYISAFPDTNSFLNGIFPIDQSGFAEFPIIGKVKVGNIKTGDLKFFLMKEFKEYLRFPNLYIKPMVRISLLGGFIRPGLYYVDINSSLWEAVNLAGGTMLEDGIYGLRWERSHKKQSSDVTRLFEKGVSLKQMGFQSGDQFWTPSPNRRTVWDTVRDVLPILTFATSMFMLYNTYQRDLMVLSR